MEVRETRAWHGSGGIRGEEEEGGEATKKTTVGYQLNDAGFFRGRGVELPRRL